ncbi:MULTISPECIES: glycosyltransferase family 1 protein [unclassified Coleofasciculus]|uniref:glycosyltransferase family 1 protein n=1 Tax=unclassified Coleofasciculus TaxID=2692782 RepID=UPI00188262E2|nr:MULTISPECIES: glycosyltransferase family 1 protein [unclassified Coleofasciculus]MBE9124678.1 glycosyltransferase family 1 protein [Coleofasciculus sp. LEGE 07081]MBE9147005.1 glycosyltransferase family 1 protein [Coleofasciculus sp. LEGE 07092]
MQLMHPGLKDLLLIDQYVKNKTIGFLSIETPIPPLVKKVTQSIQNYSIGLQLRREYRHISMGVRAFKLKDIDMIFVFEIYNQHLFSVLPLLALCGKEVLISLHGNQQFAMNSRIKFWGLLYLKKYLRFFSKLKVILFEIDDDVIPEKFRLPDSSKVIIPHPIISEATPKLMPGERLTTTAKTKIGVVGMIRQDKPISKLIEKLQDYIASNKDRCELIIGTPFGQKPDYLDKLGVKLYDTTKEDDYINVLRKIDILVIHYDKDRYYYRTSGVISDAGSCGCYIIASDYPVINHQVNCPIPIGATFSTFDEIGSLIDQGVTHIRDKGQDNHWIWREQRTAEAIAKLIFPEN